MIIIFVFGSHWQKISKFRDVMVMQWKASLGISLIFIFSWMVSGLETNIIGIILTATSKFSQCLIGLTLARGIKDFEPLPVTSSVIRREYVWRSIGLLMGVAILTTIVKPIIGSIGTSIGQIFGEVYGPSQITGEFPSNIYQTFFLLFCWG